MAIQEIYSYQSLEISKSCPTTWVHFSLQKRRSIRKQVIASVTTIILGVITFSGIAFSENHERRRQTIEQLIANAETLFQQNNQIEGLLTAIKAGQEIKVMNRWLSDSWLKILQPKLWKDTEIKTSLTLMNMLLNIQELNRIEQHDGAINEVDFSSTCSDGEAFIASASDDHTVTIWSTDGIRQKDIPHKQSLTSVNFSSDCQFLLTGNLEGANLWTLNGEHIRKIDDGWVTDVQVSPDGTKLLTVHHEGEIGQVRLWDSNGIFLKEFEVTTHEGSSASFNQDSNMIAFAGRNDIHVWDIDGEFQQILNKHNDRISSVSFHPDNHWLVSADNRGVINIWAFDGDSFSLTHSEQDAHEARIKEINFSPDGEIFASASYDRTLKIWDFSNFIHTSDLDESTLGILQIFAEYGESVNSVSFSPNGENIVTGDEGKALRIWDLNQTYDNSVIKIQDSSGRTLKTRFDTVNKILARTQNDGNAELWNLVTGQKIDITIAEQLIEDMAFNSERKIFASLSFKSTDFDSREITFWDLKGTNFKRVKEDQNRVYQEAP